MAERLDVYEVACLAGGQDRVVDAALVALVESGRVQVTAPGELVTTSLVRRHAVEAAVLDAFDPAGHGSVETIRWRLAADERILGVARRLRDAGLLGTGAVPTARRSGWRLAPTYAGRHLLHELRGTPPADDVAGDTDAMTVALHGCAAMPDQVLCASIFEQPPSRITLENGVPAPHTLDHAEDVHATTQAHVAAQTAAGRHVGYNGSSGI